MPYLPPVLAVSAVALAFVLGAVVGSFANCVAVRRATGESVLRGRSHCPSCGNVLGAADLVPVASWLALRGSCRHCGARIPVRYVVVELVAGAAFAVLVAADAASAQGIGLHTLQNLALASILLYASLVDLDSRTIPNGCIVAAVAVRAAYIVLAGPVFHLLDGAALARFSLVGAVAVAVPMCLVVFAADRVFGRESMGGGDLKLLFVAGLFFGWRQCLFLVIAACIAGIAGALVAQGRDVARAARDGRGPSEPLRHRQIPFGPAIAAACVLTMAVGSHFVQWYESLF